MSKNAPRIAAIGFGLRGGLLNTFAEAGAEVVGVADPSEKAQARFREKFPDAPLVTDDYRRLLDDKSIDAIFVVSPDYLHEEHGLATLQSGKFVYLEKPLAISTEGCDRLLQADAKAGGRLLVGHNLRTFPVFVKMKELLEAGAIGEIKAGWCRHFVAAGGDYYFKDWHAERRYTHGLLLQKGSHDIDMLHWLCNSYTKRVTAMGALTVYDKAPGKRDRNETGDATPDRANWPPLSQKGLNPDMDVEDLSMVLMELESGVMCSYQQCHYAPDVWRNYTIIGTEGRMENINDVSGQSAVRVWNRRTGYNDFGDEQYFIPPASGSHSGADLPLCKSFIRFVRGEASPSVPPTAARQSVATGDYATRSLRSGSQPMDIPALPQFAKV